MKTVLLIDGGYLRACCKAKYDNDLIENFAKACFDDEEYLFRIFYYDSPQFRGSVELPVSGEKTSFQSSDKWLKDLAKRERFAVRQGTLGFRGWKPKKIPIADKALTDKDFSPVFEQKGVDMRIGLDIASFSERESVDRILLMSGDTDMIPAMKQARKSGLEVGLIQLPKPAYNLHDTLQYHCDFVRNVGWPKQEPET
jgi:uncharacterized LabA/DUF88 family protein